MSRRTSPKVVAAPFSDFVAELRRGNVTTVDVGNDSWDIALQSTPEGTVMRVAVVPAMMELFRSQLADLMSSKGGQHVVVRPRRAGLLNALAPLLLVLLPVAYGAMLYYMVNRLQNPRGEVGKRARPRFEQRVRFEDVAGVSDAKSQLQELVRFLKNPAPFVALGARIPKGLLLYGKPGTGKTLLARAVAGEAGVPFLSCSASDFVELLVGRGASRVRDLFTRARSVAPCIVFIDELDALGKSRGGLNSHDEREQTLNALLTEMDGFDNVSGKPVVVLCATNRAEVLDAALTRPGRFDRMVAVPLPDMADRSAILRVHARRVVAAPDVDFDRLAAACSGFSGADLAGVVNEAALIAVRRTLPAVTAECFEGAVADTLRRRRGALPAVVL